MKHIYVLFLEDFHLYSNSGGGNIFRKGDIQRFDPITNEVIGSHGSRYSATETKALLKNVKIVTLVEAANCPTCGHSL